MKLWNFIAISFVELIKLNIYTEQIRETLEAG